MLASRPGGWCLYYSERGLETDRIDVDTEDEACTHLLRLLRGDPTTHFHLVVGPLPAREADDAFERWREAHGFDNELEAAVAICRRAPFVPDRLAQRHRDTSRWRFGPAAPGGVVREVPSCHTSLARCVRHAPTPPLWERGEAAHAVKVVAY
jgi:hypothetical protein